MTEPSKPIRRVDGGVFIDHGEGEPTPHPMAFKIELATMEPEARLRLDVATLVARLRQIDREGSPEHWLWGRIVTCDLERLMDHDGIAEMVLQGETGVTAPGGYCGGVTTASDLTAIATTLDGTADNLRTVAADIVDTATLEAQLAAARADVDRLTGELATATADAATLLAERDALTVEVDRLEAALAACEAGDPDPDPGPAPMIWGPVDLPVGRFPRPGPGHEQAPQLAGYYRRDGQPMSPTDNPTRGTAPVEGVTPSRLRIILSAADKVSAGGATGMHEQHLRFRDAPQMTCTFQLDRLIETPELGRYFKTGGLVAFDGDWSGGRWPDGHSGEPVSPNAMIRACGWNYPVPDVPGDDRLVSLLTLGDRYASAAVVLNGDGTPGRRYIWPDGRTLEPYIEDPLVTPIPVGKWVRLRYVCRFAYAAADGWVDIYASVFPPGTTPPPMKLVQQIRNLRWAPYPRSSGQQGFNEWYTSTMCGGSTVDWAPANPTQTGTHLIEGLKIWAGEVRPA